MRKLKELNEKRQPIWKEIENLRKQVAEGKEFTAEERAKFDDLSDQFTKLTAEIKDEERALQMEAEMAEKTEIREDKPKDEKKIEYKDAFGKWMRSRNGVNDLSGEEREILLAEFRAQSTLTGAAGGFTVPQDFYNQLEIALKYYCNFFDFATVFSTDSGSDMPYPTNNDTSNKATILGENTAITDNIDLTFAATTFKAWMYHPRNVFLVSLQLMQDSAFNMETVIANAIGERFGRGLAEHFTTGNGTTQPQGIVTGAAASGVRFARTAFTRVKMLDLKFAMDAAYRKDSKWMFNDTTLKAILALVGTDGRPLYQMSPIVGQPDTIEGHQYIINNDMAGSGTANNKSVLFGKFDKYFIRQVKGLSLVRFDEKYMNAAQIGWTAFGRWDGRVIDAGTKPIMYGDHAAT